MKNGFRIDRTQRQPSNSAAVYIKIKISPKILILPKIRQKFEIKFFFSQNGGNTVIFFSFNFWIL